MPYTRINGLLDTISSSAVMKFVTETYLSPSSSVAGSIATAVELEWIDVGVVRMIIYDPHMYIRLYSH